MLRVRLAQRASWYRNGLRIVIALAAGIQLVVTSRNYIIPWMTRVSDGLDQPAWERSALYLEGLEFAEYIGFLREHIPEDGRVILAPREPVRAIAHVGLIQYFLFPRDIHNCGIDEVEECVRRVRGSNTFILADESFPPKDLAAEFKQFIEFNEDLGLFAPR